MALCLAARLGQPRFLVECAATAGLRTVQPRRGPTELPRRRFSTAVLESTHPGEVRELIADGRPFVLHCGISWLRNTAVADRVAAWAGEGGDGDDDVRCVSLAANGGAGADLFSELHITSLPAVLLFRAGRAERKAIGADPVALERLLAQASAYAGREGAEGAEADVQTLVALADEALRVSNLPKAAETYGRALGAGPTPHDFRARLGLLRCALGRVDLEAQYPPSAELSEGVVSTLAELLERHELEVQSEAADAPETAKLLAHIEMLVDAWHSPADGEEARILHLYAKGSVAEAMQAALSWYQREAANGFGGLIESYMAPGRRVPDRLGCGRDVPPESVFASGPLACDLDDAPGPARPRALLRRLIAALGPTHELVSNARADLAFLLDRKPFVRFFTRQIFIRRGGAPARGRGTGSGSGYSKPYWIYWGPGTDYRNQKKLFGPHSATLD